MFRLTCRPTLYIFREWVPTFVTGSFACDDNDGHSLPTQVEVPEILEQVSARMEAARFSSMTGRETSVVGRRPDRGREPNPHRPEARAPRRTGGTGGIDVF